MLTMEYKFFSHLQNKGNYFIKMNKTDVISLASYIYIYLGKPRYNFKIDTKFETAI